MENATNTEANTAPAPSCCAPAAKSGGLNSRNVLIGATVAGGAAAMFFGWDWLVAAGVATFIVALAPCAAMCALGLCASRMGKKAAAPSVAALPPQEAHPPVETMASSNPAAEMTADAQPAAEMVADVQPAAAIAANVQPAAVEEAKSA